MRCSPACLSASFVTVVGLAAQTPAGSAPSPTTPAVTATAPAAPTALRERPRPADAKALLGVFARMPGLEATWEEAKHIGLLAAPLRSSGRLLFLPPGYLYRAVEKPETGSLRITPDELQVEDKAHRETIDLQRSDTVRTFVTALVQVFAGNEATLQKAFAVTYAPAAADVRAWTLTLKPKEERLGRLMRELVLRGEGEAVLAIEVTDPNGDRTTTRILTADIARKFDTAEKQRWFGIAPK
ncbi:MAG: outer membrane lipoprotein carrier protein LolA [Planctomycetes bacterium]|nr:outer membrane lipoprotein carrier protein LolA [Planctomycetota bacterium]